MNKAEQTGLRNLGARQGMNSQIAGMQKKLGSATKANYKGLKGMNPKLKKGLGKGKLMSNYSK